jgi:hypothetical protein
LASCTGQAFTTILIAMELVSQLVSFRYTRKENACDG